MGLLDRIPGLSALTTTLEYINPREILDVAPAFKRLATLYRATNYDADDEVGALIDAGFYAVRQVVEVTRTTIDDEVVASVEDIAAEQRHWLIAAIRWLKSNPDATQQDFEVCTLAMTAPGPDKGKRLITLALELWALFRKLRE